MKNILVILAVVMGVMVGKANAQYCTDNSRYTNESFFDSAAITIANNVQYGIAQDYMGNADTLRMDLYYPNVMVDTSAKRPFVLLFHGGGFSSGDKQSGDIRDLCIHMALRGFVCASANYRLGHDFSEYGQYKARYRAIQDGHAAMRYVVNNANAVRIDTNWLFAGGQSAGSLLALGMVYADPAELDSVGLLYSTVAPGTELGNLYTSGNSLTNTYTIKGIFNNWGAIPANEMDDNENLPTIAFHGQRDTTVLIDADNSLLHYSLLGSRAIHGRLTAGSMCSELTVDTMGEHGIYRNASAVFRAQRASCFFKSLFCNTCNSLYTTDSLAPNCTMPTGFAESQPEPAITLFPNPVGHSFTIEGVDGLIDVTVYNSLGQMVYTQRVTNRVVPMNGAPGLYWVRITEVASHKTYSARLLKQ